jgi:hypothetical protein
LERGINRNGIISPEDWSGVRRSVDMGHLWGRRGNRRDNFGQLHKLLMILSSSGQISVLEGEEVEV